MSGQVQHVETPFGEIAYVEQGTGPTALFVHGVFLNHHLWRHVVAQVADLRRCIAIDLMAHGATRCRPDQDQSLTAQAEMLEAFCAAMGLEAVDLVANDSGAGIAQIFAARFPRRIRTLTLTNGDTHDNWPPAPFKPMVALAQNGGLVDAMRPMLDNLDAARGAFGGGFEHPEAISDATFRTYLGPLFASEESAAALQRFVASLDCRHTVAIEPQLRRLAAPTLVVWGTDDAFFPTSWAHWLGETIPGCRKVIELEGARLFFPEERPAALADALREHWGVGA